MDRPDLTEQYQQMAKVRPSNLLEGEVPHLIDEWQIAPNIWNAVRYEVDKNRASTYNCARVKMTIQNNTH